MNNNKPSSYLISLLPIILAASFIAGLMFLFDSASPALAYSGGYALEFDGDTDFAELDRAINILGNNWQYTKTISMWVRPTAAAPVLGNVAEIVDGTFIFGDHPRWFGIYQAEIAGQDRIWIWNVDTPQGGVGLSIIGIPYTIGEWAHITLVHGNTTLEAYKNGVLIGTETTAPTAVSHPGSHTIRLRLGGSIQSGIDGYVTLFEGQIDEVRIYSDTLSAQEIRQDMYRTLDGSDPRLGAYYPMSDGTGDTVTNHSTNDCNNYGSDGCDGTLLDGIDPPVAADGDYAKWVTSGAFAGPRNTLDFDGSNDYVDLGTNSNTMIGSSWASTKSTSMWIKPTGSSPSVTDAASGDWIFGAHDGANARWGVSQATIGTEDKIWVWNVDSDGEDRIGIDYDANEWIQVSLVHDSGTLTAYKNGVEVNNTSSGSTVGDGTLTISGLSGGQNFQGQVDEVRVWDDARLETEIRNDAFHTLAHDESGLVAYYRFDQDDDSSHTDLFNIVTDNFTGTLTNMDPGADWETSAAFNTWIGSDSANWATGGNWSRYAPPVITDHVGIYNYTGSNQPTITSTVAISNIVVTTGGVLSIGDDGKLSVGSGDTLMINTGANLNANGSGIFEIIGSGDGILVNGTVTNNGTFQHAQDVNGVSKAFLHLEDEDGTTNKYRGAAITTTNSLGNVTVTVKSPSPYCTNDEDTSPVYANRCIEINAENSDEEPSGSGL